MSVSWTNEVVFLSQQKVFEMSEEKKEVSSEEKNDLPCYCGEISDIPMIQCESCYRWVHLQCVTPPLSEYEAQVSIYRWYCHNCRSTKSLEIEYKKNDKEEKSDSESEELDDCEVLNEKSDNG